MTAPIVLLEINRGLSLGVPGASPTAPAYPVEAERYLGWLVDLLVREQAVTYLVTARPVCLAARTCRTIAERFPRWRPAGVFFSDAGLLDHAHKEQVLLERIRPRHPGVPLIAIEPSPTAAAMYRRHGIPAHRVCPALPWQRLPT